MGFDLLRIHVGHLVVLSTVGKFLIALSLLIVETAETISSANTVRVTLCGDKIVCKDIFST